MVCWFEIALEVQHDSPFINDNELIPVLRVAYLAARKTNLSNSKPQGHVQSCKFFHYGVKDGKAVCKLQTGRTGRT